ncbi:MAG: AraC family transcriptional regulator [Pseudomonadota bacterium]
MNEHDNQASASNPRYRISVAGCRLMLEIARENNIDANDLLQGLGLDVATFDNPDADIEAGQQLAMMLRLHTLMGERARGLGLAIGTRIKVTFFGIWGYALLCSPTLRDAADLAQRYLDLSNSPARVRIEYGEVETRLVIDVGHLPESIRILAAEVVGAATMSIIKDIFNTDIPLPLLRMQVMHQPQADLEEYRKVFGILPDFGSDRYMAVADTRLLSLRLPRGNALTWKMCQAQCHALLQKRRFRQGWSGRVRERLVQEPDAMPSLEQLAKEFSLSSQQLRRQLAAEKTNFRSLMDEVKRLLAEEMLARGDIYVQEVAIRLGYESTISFTQSFKRWTGITPSDYLRGKRTPG